MRLIRTARFLALLALTASTFALAQARQATVTPEPTGTVTGKVFCADTNEPARFAQVSLENIPAPSAKKPEPEGFAPPADSSGAGKVQTTLDGSFTLTHVKPGSYYVVVTKQGYLAPRDLFTPQQLADASPEMLVRRAEAIAHVKVEANHTETVEVRLERGASVSGTVLYDDGTPAGGLQIHLLRKDSNRKWIHLQFNGAPGSSIATDDRGTFRATSLLPGDYIIEADLSLYSSKTRSMKLEGNMTVQIDVQTFSYSLPFYGTGTAHLAEAKPFTLRAGQETPGQDMILPIAKLHKITGHVAAGRDAHFVNAATVSLVSRDDNKELASTDISREDGLFHLEFVPDGDYILKVTEARDVVWEMSTPSRDQPFNTQEKERVLATFGDTEQPIILRGDLLDTLATVSPDALPNANKPSTVNAQNGSQTGSQPDGTSPPPSSTTPPPPTDPGATPKAKSALASTF
jgi:hypothetical protein